MHYFRCTCSLASKDTHFSMERRSTCRKPPDSSLSALFVANYGASDSTGWRRERNRSKARHRYALWRQLLQLCARPQDRPGEAWPGGRQRSWSEAAYSTHKAHVPATHLLLHSRWSLRTKRIAEPQSVIDDALFLAVLIGIVWPCCLCDRKGALGGVHATKEGGVREETVEHGLDGHRIHCIQHAVVEMIVAAAFNVLFHFFDLLLSLVGSWCGHRGSDTGSKKSTRQA